MSATTWFIVSIVGFSLSGIALVVAVFMFLKINIPAVIGDLTGKTVAREIQAMRETNASSGQKISHSSMVNVDRGKLTEKFDDHNVDKSAMAIAHSSKRLDKLTQDTAYGDLPHIQTSELPASAIRKITTTENLNENVAEVEFDDVHATHKVVKKTDSLIEDQHTEVLKATQSTEVLTEFGATSVLAQPNINMAVGTTVLSEDNSEIEQTPMTSVSFKIVRSYVEIHSDETIK